MFYVFGKTDFVLVSYLPLTFSLPLILSFSFISTSHLRRMRLECCKTISDKALIEVAEKLPLLEELDVSLCYLSCKSLEAVGRCCPRLRSLKFNMEVYPRISLGYDDEAFAIAKNMPKLQHLQLIGNRLTNAGLLAILDGCPLLESLDLRGCFNVNLQGSLGKRCVEQIKELGYIPYYCEWDGPSGKRQKC